jgi:putative transposase
MLIPRKLGHYQRGLLARARSVQGGVLTKGPKGKRYINLTLRLEPPTPPTGGGPLRVKRLRYWAKRAEVQSKLDRPSERTRGVQCLWERLTGKARFVNHTPHILARRIVDGLEPGDTLAIEDLRGLRSRTAKRGASKKCSRCGYQDNADWNAAINIAQRAGSMSMGCCQPARILRVSFLHHPPSKSPYQPLRGLVGVVYQQFPSLRSWWVTAML